MTFAEGPRRGWTRIVGGNRGRLKSTARPAFEALNRPLPRGKLVRVMRFVIHNRRNRGRHPFFSDHKMGRQLFGIL